MFDIKTVPMEVTPEDGITKVRVAPADMYPLIVQRILDVLKGATPNELLATSERGGSARADRLVNEARALPLVAFEDALRPRWEFSKAAYFSFVDRNGRMNQEQLDMVTVEKQPEIRRMIQRGYVLEIALGWFLHALRLEFGAVDVILERDDAYRL